MERRDFFHRIDFNKAWDEQDWELFFQAQDAYRLSKQNAEIRRKPFEKIRFVGPDEVKAFEPVISAYGAADLPSIFRELGPRPFSGDQDPENDYHPASDEDPHYWNEGAPLATLLIYRDCCRFAICTSQEIDRYGKRRGAAYRRQHSGEFEALRFHANWVAINIAQGHQIGYSRERIQGNVAKIRRALSHADQCIGILSRVCRRTRSERLRRDLFSFAAQLRNALYDWMDEQRFRFAADNPTR